MAAPPASVFQGFPILKRPTNNEIIFRGIPPPDSVRGSFGMGSRYFQGQGGKKASTMSKKALTVPTLNQKTGLYETDFDTLKLFLADPYRDRPLRTTDEMELRRHDQKGRPPNPVALMSVPSIWKAMKVRGEANGNIYFRGLNQDGSVNLGPNTRYFTPLTLQQEVRSTDKKAFEGLAKTGNEVLLKTIQRHNNPDITVPGKRATLFHIPLPNGTTYPVCAVPLELDGYADIVYNTVQNYLSSNINRGASRAKDATIGRLLTYGEKANDRKLVNSLLVIHKDTMRLVEPTFVSSLYDADNLELPTSAQVAPVPMAPAPMAQALMAPAPMAPAPMAPTMPAIQAPQMQSMPPIPVAVSRRSSAASISDSVSNLGTPRRLSGGSQRRSSNGKKRKRTSSGSRKSASDWDDDTMLAALNSPGGAASSSTQWQAAASSSEPWYGVEQPVNLGYDFRNFNWEDSDNEDKS
ncbi:hypothetical protein EXVG_00234 [Emiliania huxleyi virus 202]|nr:hypothetical protein EXVG_00234 [Emiliania huxleyi virus 202]AHA54148.1 hypothetical protein EhV18_00101 [Emiliania huxleyi virus 18]AHA55194.1 hypothetical protein EhV156_00097 [Emiliania huxleyi virus 156]